jgi:hypothetical protein
VARFRAARAAAMKKKRENSPPTSGADYVNN